MPEPLQIYLHFDDADLQTNQGGHFSEQQSHQEV